MDSVQRNMFLSKQVLRHRRLFPDGHHKSTFLRDLLRKELTNPVCSVCGRPLTHSFPISESSLRIIWGTPESPSLVCPAHVPKPVKKLTASQAKIIEREQRLGIS